MGKLKIILAFITFWLLNSCSSYGERKTIDLFYKHKEEFGEIVKLIGSKSDISEVFKKYSHLCEYNTENNIGLGCEYSNRLDILEITPIDFYYVLVHCKEPKKVELSYSFKDEGKILKNLGNGWFLVRRGWM